jgi:ABC-type transport system substrate-binding protein
LEISSQPRRNVPIDDMTHSHLGNASTKGMHVTMTRNRTTRSRRWLPVLAGALALSALGPTVAGASAESPASSTPKSAASGTLNWYGVGLPTNGWDPTLSSAQAEIAPLALPYAGLTSIDQKGQVVPALASSWTVSPDRLAITFDIRPGLVFDDGSPVTASVVAQNISRDINQTGSTLATFLTSVKNAVAVSKYVVRFNLNVKNPELPAILGGKAGLIVGPKGLADPSSLANQPDGAGPFVLTSYVAAGSATFVKNPHYWDAKDIHIANLYVSGASSTSSAILQAVQSHQTNFADIPATDISAAQAAGYTVKIIPTLAVYVVQINTKVAPFNNQKVIEAIGDAIDRSAINELESNGLGKVDDEPFPPGYYAYDSAKSVADYYTYNPAKSEKLLAEAGYPGGAGLPTLTLTSAYTPPEGDLIQAELAQVGIKSTIDSIASASGGTTQICWYNDDCTFFLESFSGREAPSETLQLLYDQNGPGNPARETSPALERALNRLSITEPTDPSYKADVDTFQSLAVADSGQLWLSTRPQIVAYSSDVSNFTGYIDYQRLEGLTVSS